MRVSYRRKYDEQQNRAVQAMTAARGTAADSGLREYLELLVDRPKALFFVENLPPCPIGRCLIQAFVTKVASHRKLRRDSARKTQAACANDVENRLLPE